MLEDVFKDYLQIEECLALAESQAALHRCFDVLKKMERGAINNVVDGLQLVRVFAAHNLVNVAHDLGLFLLGVRLEVRLEALGYAPFEFVDARLQPGQSFEARLVLKLLKCSLVQLVIVIRLVFLLNVLASNLID